MEQTRVNFLDMRNEVPVFYFYKVKPREDRYLLQYLDHYGWVTR